MESTSVRVWKRLTREERLAAATAFWRESAADVMASALGAIVRARHVRPQVARGMADESKAQALAGILDPGESVAASLLVALHLSERRPMLAAFLDALGMPHDNGVLKEEADSLEPPAAAAAHEAVASLAVRFPAHEVGTYLNTLWLQDPERWAALADVRFPA
jgi:hypothetical protein